MAKIALRTLLAVGIGMGSQVVVAETSVCGELQETIENALKGAAMVQARNMADDSVPRATLAELETANARQVVQIHLQLLKDNGCPANKRPLTTGRYLMGALQCRNQELAQQAGKEVELVPGKPIPAACDTSKWRPLDVGVGKPFG